MNMIKEGVLRGMTLVHGYGFVETDEGDAMVHITSLKGRFIPLGSTVEVLCYKAEDGRLRVATIPRIVKLKPPVIPDTVRGTWMTGRVRWWNTSRLMGFVDCDGGASDVYINSETCANSGLWKPMAEQRVAVLVEVGPKGRYATCIVPERDMHHIAKEAQAA